MNSKMRTKRHYEQKIRATRRINRSIFSSSIIFSFIKRAQISLEYLVIVGVALALLLPGVYFFFAYSKGSIEGTTNNRLNDIGLQMVSTAKGSYALGNGARQTIEFVMPEGVEEIRLNSSTSGSGTELMFVYNTPYGLSETVFFSDIILLNQTNDSSGIIAVTPHPGVSRYRFDSHAQNVSIIEVLS